MANAQKGEVSLVIGDKTYTLALTLDAMVLLEEMFSTPEKMVVFSDVAALAERGSSKHIRALMWALFQAHHPEVAIKDVSRLVQQAGGIVGLSQTLESVLKTTSPDKRDVEALGVQNPPNAQAVAGVGAGTGASSTSTLVGKA